MEFVLDEDLPPSVATIAGGLGLDVTSVHAAGRHGLSDEEQLNWAAAEQRVLVTRNRDDFIRLTRRAFQTGSPHPGVLVVTKSLPNDRPEALAHALVAWRKRQGDMPFQECLDFLSAAR